jgi:hypothetical protein
MNKSRDLNKNRNLAGLAIAIESNADITTVMAVISPDDGLRMELKAHS